MQEPNVTKARKAINNVALALFLIVFFQALNSVVDLWTEANRRSSREDIEETLRIIREQTSPEKQAEGQAVVTNLISTMDCNTRFALEEALSELDFPVDLTPEESCPR